MTRWQLVDWVADELGLTRPRAREATDAVLEGILQLLERDGRLALRGFGTFEVRSRRARPLRHPASGAAMVAPAHRTVLFRVSERVKQRLNACSKDSSCGDSIP